MNSLSNTDRIELIRQAQELIKEAKDLIDEAVKGTDSEANYESYGRYGIDQLLGSGNSYDDSLEDLIDELKTEDESNE